MTNPATATLDASPSMTTHEVKGKGIKISARLTAEGERKLGEMIRKAAKRPRKAPTAKRTLSASPEQIGAANIEAMPLPGPHADTAKTARLYVRVFYLGQDGDLLAFDHGPLTHQAAERLRADMRSPLSLALGAVLISADKIGERVDGGADRDDASDLVIMPHSALKPSDRFADDDASWALCEAGAPVAKGDRCEEWPRRRTALGIRFDSLPARLVTLPSQRFERAADVKAAATIDTAPGHTPVATQSNWLDSLDL